MTIPNSVTSIGTAAFFRCSSLKSVTIPDKVTTIEASAFNQCSALTSVTIPSSVTEIGDNAFYGCSALTSVTGGSSIETIGNNAFYGCKELSSFTLGSSVKTIGECAFQDCSNLNVTIPNSVTSIGSSAFYRCYSLESVTIPDKVTTIEASTFNGCSKLTSVTIHDKVTKIGYSAFYNCIALTSVVIPNSVTTIGEYAFNGCSKLKEITSLATTPPTLGTNCFKNIANDYTIKVPNISVSAYQGATNWSAYKNNISALDRSYGVTISSAELATLWLEYDATVPANAEVYYASSCSDSKVKMTKITGVLPRETGVIVKGAADTYTFNEADTEGTNVSSLLVGSATTQTFNETGFMFYKLTYANSDKENLGFYLANNDGTIESKPHKAYLKLAEAPASAPTRGIGIDWGDDDSTEIESIVECDTDGDTMYNLQGMPVGNDYKGIVIKNGRKMMNK